MTDVALGCRCGKIQGIALAPSPRTGTRLICYCDDCQAFARFLGTADILDANGGSDIFQLRPSQLRITHGRELLAAVRLSSKGMTRYYASCCRTPVANTMGHPRVPFAGVVQPFMLHTAADPRDAVLGPPTRVLARFATGTPPAGSHAKMPALFLFAIVRRIVGGLVARAHRPSPFYNDAGEPFVQPTVLSAAERDRLR